MSSMNGPLATSAPAPTGPSLDLAALRDLFDGVSDFVQSVLPDGRIRFVNKPWLDRLGYTFAEVDGRNIFEIIHPESRNHCMHYMQRLIGGEDVGVMEVVFETKSGEPVQLEGKVTVQFEGGVPQVTRGVFRELSAEQRSNPSLVRLREQRKLFHTVLSILRANSHADRQQFLALATQQVASALGIARASVWLFDAAQERITCENLFADGADVGRTAVDLLRKDHPAYFEAIERRLPVLASDAHKHPATQSFSSGYLTPLGISSMLDLPLCVGSSVEGVLCCEHVGTPRQWTHDEEEFGLAVAAVLLIYIESDRRVRAEHELQRLNVELERRVEERTRKLALAEERLRYLMTAVPAVMRGRRRLPQHVRQPEHRGPAWLPGERIPRAAALLARPFASRGCLTRLRSHGARRLARQRDVRVPLPLSGWDVPLAARRLHADARRRRQSRRDRRLVHRHS
jgi:two-component system sensor histidine kinase/response regulator